jgi:rhodanese-related sulfurtransferase
MKTALALAIALFTAACAWAQTLSHGALPEALKDIKQSSGMCWRDDVAQPTKNSPAPAQEASPDLSCAIAPAELASVQNRADSLLVDVRALVEHETFRIGGAIAMTVFELRTRSVLRDKNLVLIGDGKAERELYAACAGLKARGFKRVRVLRGGMSSWLAHGGAVQGNPPDPLQSVRLSSSQLWGESQFDANLVLVTAEQQSFQDRLPFAMPVADASPAAVKSVIERRRKELKNAPLAAVVLVTSASTTDESFKRLTQALQPVPLLLYTESAQTYSRQFAQLKATWEARAKGPKRLRCGL